MKPVDAGCTIEVVATGYTDPESHAAEANHKVADEGSGHGMT